MGRGQPASPFNWLLHVVNKASPKGVSGGSRTGSAVTAVEREIQCRKLRINSTARATAKIELVELQLELLQLL